MRFFPRGDLPPEVAHSERHTASGALDTGYITEPVDPNCRDCCIDSVPLGGRCWNADILRGSHMLLAPRVLTCG